MSDAIALKFSLFSIRRITRDFEFCGRCFNRFQDFICLAYVWIVFLGILAHRQNWAKIIHRTERCDWSLFRLGLCLLDYLLNEDKPIPVTFNPLAVNYVR